MHNRAPLEIGLGEVMHARMQPAMHRFVYPVFCVRVPLRSLDVIARQNNALFSVGKRALLSFYEQDHGDRTGDLLSWLSHELAKLEMPLPDGQVWLQAMPRVMGYVFNPVSFWYMHDHAGALRLILAEVNNTFGERHRYLLSAENNGVITADTVLVCSKNFHVSPFCKVRGLYRFRYRGGEGSHRMEIDYFEEASAARPLIVTAVSYQMLPATDRNVWKVFCKMPFLTLGVVYRIHWQALQLWIKKIPFYSKPTPPTHSLTRNDKEFRQ